MKFFINKAKKNAIKNLFSMAFITTIYSIVDTYLHEKQINNLNYYNNYLIRCNYIEIYHFIIEIIFKVNSISESSYN